MAHPFLHFKTITKHKFLVMGQCFKVGLIWQGLAHDMSKYSPTEFIPGAKYYMGTSSPCNEERRVTMQSKAWMHHKGRNKHHFEYWIDWNPDTNAGPGHKWDLVGTKMPVRYVVEMYCDRVAASKNYMGKAYNQTKPLEYYNGGPTRRWLHPESADLIELLLNMLADKGEKETNRYIRKNILKGNRYK